MALDGVNSVTLTPHDGWFWGFGLLSAGFGASLLRKKFINLFSVSRKKLASLQSYSIIRPVYRHDPFGEVRASFFICEVST